MLNWLKKYKMAIIPLSPLFTLLESPPSFFPFYSHSLFILFLFFPSQTTTFPCFSSLFFLHIPSSSPRNEIVIFFSFYFSIFFLSIFILPKICTIHLAYFRSIFRIIRMSCHSFWLKKHCLIMIQFS